MDRLELEKQRILRNLSREKGDDPEMSSSCNSDDERSETIHFKDTETAKAMESSVYEFIRERSFHSVHVCCDGKGYMFSVAETSH
jgi:hypothetical protein